MNEIQVYNKFAIQNYDADLPVFFNADEIKHILEEADKLKYVGPYAKTNAKYKALTYLLIFTGCRRAEALSLTKTDIDYTNKTIKLVTLKKRPRRKKPDVIYRYVPVKDRCLLALMEYTNTINTDLIFPIKNITVNKFYERFLVNNCGIDRKRAHVHTFRHSYAVNLLMQGVPINILKELLGHSSVTTTMIYLKITQQDIKEILKNVSIGE